MARYGTWKPLSSNWSSQARLTSPDLIVLHTMAGSLAGTDSYFRQGGYGGVESHFGVGGDGGVWQWQDTSRVAEANYRGNHRIISIETADRGTGFPVWAGNDVPAWTGAQVDALVKLVAFLCEVHDIPCRLVPDSKPGRRGVGHHRLGIDPWRVSGGEVWSSARGKACPGDRRIAQLPGIIAAATGILDGETGSPAGVRDLRRGDIGPDVEALQRKLAAWYRLPPTWVDGVFGPDTERYVIRVQVNTPPEPKLTGDGVCGPMTRKKLGL